MGDVKRRSGLTRNGRLAYLPRPDERLDETAGLTQP